MERLSKDELNSIGMSDIMVLVLKLWVANIIIAVVVGLFGLMIAAGLGLI